MHKLWNKLKREPLTLWFLSTLWCYFAIVFFNLIVQDSAGNIYIQQNNTWADWAIHFSQGSALAERSLWLRTSPILLGAPFTYPYLVNWFSAVLTKFGVPFFAAFTVPSYLIVSAGITGLFFLYRVWLKQQLLAIAATVLFLCNGGWGIVTVLKDGLLSGEATHHAEQGIHWISIINSMFIPQRTFGLGFLVGICVLLLLYYLWEKQKLSAPIVVIFAVLLGSLPIIHMHTFAALGIYLSAVLIGLLLLRGNTAWSVNKLWFALGGGTLFVAMLVMHLFYPELQTGNRLRWLPGWLATEENSNWLLFWWRNWGFVPLLGIGGVVVSFQRHRQLFPWLIASVVLFGVGNLFTFQMYTWDNTKLFAWASVGITALAIIFLNALWQSHRWGRLVAAVLFAVSIAAGLHDAIYTLKFSSHSYLMYSQEELALSEWAKHTTAPNTVWLTSDKHNHWLYNLTGRQPVMGYQGWLWSHGYDYEHIAADVKNMYAAPDEYLALFSEHGISYVVVGPTERKQFNANSAAFENTFIKIKETTTHTIFAVEPQPE